MEEEMRRIGVWNNKLKTVLTPLPLSPLRRITQVGENHFGSSATSKTGHFIFLAWLIFPGDKNNDILWNDTHRYHALPSSSRQHIVSTPLHTPRQCCRWRVSLRERDERTGGGAERRMSEIFKYQWIKVRSTGSPEHHHLIP